jgi:hypothetical protein
VKRHTISNILHSIDNDEYICGVIMHWGRAMAQVVSCRPRTTEAGVPARVSPCGICGGKVALRQVLPRSLRFSPVNIFSPWLSIFMNHLGMKKQVRWWPQFRDTVSPHWHAHEHNPGYSNLDLKIREVYVFLNYEKFYQGALNIGFVKAAEFM